MLARAWRPPPLREEESVPCRPHARKGGVNAIMSLESPRPTPRPLAAVAPRSAPRDDAQLLTLCQRASRGDRRALGELIQASERFLWPLCWRGAGGRRADAEDLLSETLLRATRGIGGYDPSRPFGAWLRGIASRVIADSYRRRRLELTDAEPEAPAPPPETPADDRERVRRAMAGLQPEEQVVLLLKHGEGLSIQEVATLLGKSHEATKKRAQRALAALRARLGETR